MNENHRFSLLLVDDDKITREALSHSLKQEGYSVSTAADPECALTQVEEDSFDLVITDLIMAPMDGIELTRRIKAIRPDIMVVILTAYGDLRSAIEAIRAEADDYILKQPELQSMILRIRTCFERLALKKRSVELERLVEQRTLKLRQEVRQRKLAEEQWRDIGERFQQLTEALQVIVFTRTSDGKILYINEVVQQELGYTPKELIGTQIGTYLLRENPEAAINPSSNPSVESPFRNTEWVWTKNGEKRLFEVSQFTVQLDNKDEVVHGMAWDVTERVFLFHELVRSERFAATGQLAAFVAHQINSPMQGITSLLSYLQKTRDNDADLQDSLKTIKEAFTSIAGTIRRLLDLNRPSKEQKQIVNINELINDTLALAKSYLKQKRITVKTELDPKLRPINAAPALISHVLMNLINNSSEAIEAKEEAAGGRHHSGTRHEEILIRTRQSDTTITITVSDTGIGIEEDELERIFDMFYTKKTARGMGLGLSLSREIVREHGGTIIAANRRRADVVGDARRDAEVRDAGGSPGRRTGDGSTCLGAEFTITLPALTKPEQNSKREN